MYRPLPWPGPPSPGTPPHHLCHNFSHQESPQKLDSGGGDIIEGSGGVSILRDDEADEGGGFDAQAWIFQEKASRSLLWKLNSLIFSVTTYDKVIDTTTPSSSSSSYSPWLFLTGGPHHRRSPTMFVKWPKNVQIQRNKRILKQRLNVPLAWNQFTTTLDKNLAEIRKALKEGRKPTTSPPDGDEDLSFAAIFPLAVAHTMGNLLTNISLCKVPKGNPYHNATSREMVIYRANNIILRKFLEEEEDVMEGIQVNVYDKGRHRFKLMLNKMIQVGLVTGELSPVWHTQLTFSCEELTWWQVPGRKERCHGGDSSECVRQG
ncbi:hypothetical protein JHK86_000758 [Glycine max]|nr:hypothetical protein JHK86_000758 [Glycine max]